jgi:hypothetical protein
MQSLGSMRFWQLPANLRSLACTGSAVSRRGYSVTARLRDAPEPLKILFCGSDYFSIESLRALNQERLRGDSKLIQSIDVVHRSAKPTGRGMKTLREGMCVFSHRLIPSLFCTVFTTLRFPGSPISKEPTHHRIFTLHGPTD